MKTLTVIEPETLLHSLDVSIVPKYYLAISVDTLVVIDITNDTFSVLEHIIVGSDTNANLCVFDYMDDMLDVIHIVKSELISKGYIYLENHFNINL